jgi:hypothetical protein
VTLRLPLSGLAPLLTAMSLLALPRSLSGLGLDLSFVTDLLPAPGAGRHAVELVLVLTCTVLLGRWFNAPSRVVATLRQQGLAMPARALGEALRPLFRRAMARSLLVLGLLYATVVLRDRLVPATSLLDAATVAALAAVLLDLATEWRVRRAHGGLTTVRHEHRLYAVDAQRAALEDAGLTVHLRAVQHRTLLQFYGPYVPVAIMVPDAQAAKAREVLAAGDDA